LLTLCVCLTLLLLSQRSFAQSQVSWTAAGPPASSDRIIALATDPRDSSIIYAAAPGGGIWKTQDSGLTWTPVFDSQPSLQVCSLAVDPRFPDVLYAGTGDDQSPRQTQGVARSTDAGRSWTAAVRMTNRPVCALAVDPTNTARLLAGSEEGLFLSTDSGTTWTRVLTSPVTSIAFGGPGVVYAGILGDESPGARQHILTRSSDSGRTWADLTLAQNLSAPSAATNWVTVRASRSEVSVAVAYQSTGFVGPLSQLDFYGSNDGGNHWFATYGIGQARPPMAFAVDANGNLKLAGATLLTSADYGFTWSVVPTKTTGFHAATLISGALLLAGDMGFEFVPPGLNIAPLPVSQILGVSIDTATRIWAGGPSGLFRLLPPMPYTGTRQPDVGGVGRIAVAESTNGSTAIYAAGAIQVYSSEDGSQFSAQGVIAVDEARAPYPPIVVDPVVISSAYVAGRRVYHTTNTGGAWTALSIVDPDPTRVVIALAMAPAARSTLFAATACLPEVALTSCPAISFVWRSTNAGQTWTQMSVVAGFVNQFAIDPRQSTRVYAAIGAFPAGPSKPAGLISGDLLLSTNAGGAWSSLLGNLPRTAINAILVDPASLPAQFIQPAQTVYAGADAGVFVSFDAGTRWMELSTGLPRAPVTSLSLLQPDGILVAGTFGRGVYRASVAGLAPGLIVRPLSQDLTLMEGTTDSVGITLDNLSSSPIEWQLTALDKWLSVPQPNGSLRPSASTQVAVGVSSADLRRGTYIGRLQLTSALGAQTVIVDAQITPTPAQMNITGGNNASGLPGTPVPPLQVRVLDENLAPLANVPVTFTITSGGGSLSARTVSTNASGDANVVLTLPQQPATVQVIAASGKLSVTFTAIALAAPSLLTDSIFDAVTFNSNTSFGPGTILAILGENLASDSAVAPNALPTMLASTRVLLKAENQVVLLPLFSVSSLQIVALMPFDILPGRYLLHCEVGDVRSNEVEISVAAFAPGIFTLNGAGFGAGVFMKDNGSVVSSMNPADRGSRVTFYAAGLGAVSPPVEAGQTAASTEPLNRTNQTPRVFFDRYSANVVYSGLSPGIPGRYQVTVQVPALVSPATNVSVSMTIGGFTSNRVTIPVR